MLVVIGLLIGGFVCWIKQRNSHFKHHSTEPDQIVESVRCLDPDISVLTSVPGSSGNGSPTTSNKGGCTQKVYFETCKNSKESSKNLQINRIALEPTEPPSYEEVIDRKKDSRDDSQIIARL